jgi:hypothetical protein
MNMQKIYKCNRLLAFIRRCFVYETIQMVGRYCPFTIDPDVYGLPPFLCIYCRSTEQLSRFSVEKTEKTATETTTTSLIFTKKTVTMITTTTKSGDTSSSSKVEEHTYTYTNKTRSGKIDTKSFSIGSDYQRLTFDNSNYFII